MKYHVTMFFANQEPDYKVIEADNNYAALIKALDDVHDKFTIVGVDIERIEFNNHE